MDLLCRQEDRGSSSIESSIQHDWHIIIPRLDSCSELSSKGDHQCLDVFFVVGPKA